MFETEWNQDNRDLKKVLNERDSALKERDLERDKKEHAQLEVIRLSDEISRLKHQLSIKASINTTPTSKSKQTQAKPKASQTPKQAEVQFPQQIQVRHIIPSRTNGWSQNKKFFNDNSGESCTIATEPIIQDGIVYYEVVETQFNERFYSFGVGITDASVVFRLNKEPFHDGHDKSTIGFYNWNNENGVLYHMNEIFANSKFSSGQKIGAEVDMDSQPRTLTFYIDDVEQPDFIFGIPEAIRFWAYIRRPSSSFTVSKFERRQSSSAHRFPQSKGYDIINVQMAYYPCTELHAHSVACITADGFLGQYEMSNIANLSGFSSSGDGEDDTTDGAIRSGWE
ncbi:MAG: hypothetical protein EZS28_030341 [Streblomastix strix]|uniref:B30.2/SPRY domain-containing protein n=1 Tax=Streblomastix strix TaxID=222440 RepID=A0A5J4UUW1_9EUKA|nr:MAG: hypothetical protein EZS28_030341 [Streblomastix strix]